MTAAERIAKDFRGIAKRDFPISFRIGSKVYTGVGTFNQGDINYIPVPGYTLEDFSGPVLMVPTADLPAIGIFEYVSVQYLGKWTKYEVDRHFPGQAVTTLTLMSESKE